MRVIRRAIKSPKCHLLLWNRDWKNRRLSNQPTRYFCSMGCHLNKTTSLAPTWVLAWTTKASQMRYECRHRPPNHFIPRCFRTSSLVLSNSQKLVLAHLRMQELLHQVVLHDFNPLLLLSPHLVPANPKAPASCYTRVPGRDPLRQQDPRQKRPGRRRPLLL